MTRVTRVTRGTGRRSVASFPGPESSTCWTVWLHALNRFVFHDIS